MARRGANALSPRAMPRDAETKVDARGVIPIKGVQGAGMSAETLTEVVVVWASPGNGAAATTVNDQVHPVAAAPGIGQGGTGGATETIKPSRTAAVPGKGASHTVKVGGPGGLTYQPEQLNNVPVGDTVVFEFLAQNHSVTQAAFDSPCLPLAGGMDSGFIANPNNSASPPPRVAMRVMTTKPLWFYCRQKGHCGKGMVFSINPTSDKTHAMFRDLAIKKNGGEAGTAMTGGQQQNVPPTAEAPKQRPAGVPEADVSRQSPVAGQSKPADQASTSIVSGKGTVGADGSCSCVASCSPGGFPAAQAQGVGAFGGMAGAIPVMGSMS
ncbi:hypothetical protein E4U53_006823 [Claviceps sorghi]|nr:hypothetical protein E4U53_006823 [Claviceps sorghi]